VVYAWFGIIESPLVERLLLFFGVDGMMADNTAEMLEMMGR
jgi:hypothetical protein